MAAAIAVVAEEIAAAGVAEAGSTAVVGAEIAETAGAAEATGALEAEELGAAEAAETTTATSTVGKVLNNPLAQGSLFTVGSVGISTLWNRVGSIFTGHATHYSAEEINASNKAGLMLLALGVAGYFLLKRM